MDRFAGRIQAFALVLGGPGLLLVALLDSSFLSLPEVTDLLLIVMVTEHKARMVYYASAATLGSIAGCLALYYVGRRGDAWIGRRFSAARVARAMAMFQKYGVLAVLIPSLLPPPAPFKIFVLLAGISGISVARFTVAIAIGRGIRYFGEGLLALWYGDRAIEFVEIHGREVALVIVGLLVLALAAYLLPMWVRRTRTPVNL
jgi:membrane protein YqaA with SNARE-associated domain